MVFKSKRIKGRVCVFKGCKKGTLLYSKSFCKEHYLTYMAYRALGRGTKETAQKLKALFEKQKEKCYYTNKKLILGKNTSIDHRIPLSRGGKKEISNLLFVIPEINSLKNSSTEKEFLKLIKKIYLKHLNIK